MSSSESKGPANQQTGAEDETRAPLPKVDFSTFALSLGTTGLYQLGILPDSVTGEPAEPDPLVAQQTIDTLEMLRDKTRGNLDEEERKLIDSLLYELRMRFVEKTR